MTRKVPVVKPISRSLQQAGALALGYVILILILPPSEAGKHAYHLSSLGYRAALLAVALPSMLAWVAAFVGAARLRQFVGVVSASREGSHFEKLAGGATWLAWSLPVPSIVSLLFSTAASEWPGVHTATTIVGNYLYLILPLVGYSLMGDASRALINQARLKFSIANIRAIIFTFLAAGVLYCYLIFRRLDLTSLGSADNIYRLPVWLVVLTIIVPYLYAWFAGLLAAYEITLFSRHTAGVLYRQALQPLVVGLTIIILSSIALQYFSSVLPVRDHLVLDSRLILTLILRLIEAAGFLLMALGATRLKRIEEL